MNADGCLRHETRSVYALKEAWQSQIGTELKAFDDIRKICIFNR